MAASMLQNSKSICQLLTKVDNGCFLQSVRNAYKYRHRGKHPLFAKSWKQKLSEIEAVPPEEDMAVNIGFPHTSATTVISKRELRRLRRAQDEVELERKSRMRELLVPLEEVSVENFEGAGQEAIHTLANHFGIFRDLFAHAYFYPQIQLEIGYEIDEEPDMMNRVFHGNILTPAETAKVPDVHFKGDPDKFYTLCMVAPDSHLENNDKEYLHWMVGNIPGSSVNEGDVIFDYLPVFPVKGTGYHRYVFILFQQEKTLDFTKENRSPNCTSLVERTFEMLEYYRDKQDDMTPVGLSFFQAEWDGSVRNVFHNILDMNEPRFEFLPPAPYIRSQKLWPIRKPFHVYMDSYRDVKDIGEEVLLEKLKNDPFKPRPEPEKYPNLYTLPKDTPSWLRMKIKERKLKQSYWKYLDD